MEGAAYRHRGCCASFLSRLRRRLVCLGSRRSLPGRRPSWFALQLPPPPLPLPPLPPLSLSLSLPLPLTLRVLSLCRG